MPRSNQARRRDPRRAVGLGVERLEARQVLASGPFVGVRLVSSGNESGPTPTVFEFRRSGATTVPLVVNAYLSGTATANVDFNAPPTLQPSGRFTATIPAGQSTVRLVLATRPDSVYDPAETVSVVVGLSAGYVIQPAGDHAEAILGAEGVTGIVADEESLQTYGYRSAHGYTFVAVAPDGSVVPVGGGMSPGVDLDGPSNDLTVVRVVANARDFAALRSDGSVVTWRSPVFVGESLSFQNAEFNNPASNPSIVRIVASANAFAALRSDGSIISWGDGAPLRSFTGSFTQLVSNAFAFAALRGDGEVVTWGSSDYGGYSSWVQFKGPNGDLAVTKIIPGPMAFVAIRSDGSAVTWGYPFWEGANGAAPIDLNGPKNDLTIASIVSSGYSFCALRSDGSVVAWGPAWYGGDASSVDFDGPQNNLTVVRIFPLENGYAALRSDGTVVAWGGISSLSSIATVDFNGPNDDLTVTQIVSSGLKSCAALRSDGSVVAWGENIDLFHPPNRPLAVNGAFGEFTVSKLIAMNGYIAALRSDGWVVQFPDRYVWYQSAYFRGSNNDLAVTGLINSTRDSIAALRSDGTMVDTSLGATGKSFRAATITSTDLIVTTRALAPAGVVLSASTVNEGMPIGTVVGKVVALDANPGDTFTYALVSGAGGEDNAAFRIRGDSLRTAATFDFELKDRYSVRIRATDNTGLSIEKVLVIRISDVLEPLRVEGVRMPEPGTYGRGDTLRFTVALTRPVFVVGGAPTIDVMTGAGVKAAVYMAGSGTNSLVFEYTVRASDSASAVVLGSVIRLPHQIASIRDATGSPIRLTIPGGRALGVSIDTTAPALLSVVIPAVRVYRDGETLRFAAAFSEPVVVRGTPFLTISLNEASVREAKYVSGSGTRTLFFEYRVRVAGTAPRILAAVTGLRLGDGSITDVVRNMAEFDVRKARRATVLWPSRYPRVMSD